MVKTAVYKPSRYLNRPARDSEDSHGSENVLKPSLYLKKAARDLEDFHGGENDVLKPSLYLKRPVRASEDSTVVKTALTNLHGT